MHLLGDHPPDKNVLFFILPLGVTVYDNAQRLTSMVSSIDLWSTVSISMRFRVVVRSGGGSALSLRQH